MVDVVLAHKYDWPLEKEFRGTRTFKITPMPEWHKNRSIPNAGLNNNLRNRLILVPKAQLTFLGDNYDGFLGGKWHAEKIIEWNYIKHTMAFHSSIDRTNIADLKSIPAPILKNAFGNYVTAFPRIEITVDGTVHSMLFDTGATIKVSSSTQVMLGAKGSLVGASYMIASIFDEWHNKHPDWRYIEEGDLILGKPLPLIEVPKIEIAGLEVGPVWFARRPDKNFVEGMGPFMDQPIDGAVGGSLLQYFRVIMDYPDERAYFSRK
ncbi:hypothetical protein [Kordiimonas laminariae]|uniref:hypothetical protein n=1 Tax=Kordiimonas laminariae TaxID=2917717 RepID=UPI001FF5406C|nr:hypothetical protein [Kordiimonas laminariae]MCK0069419.1 hypothetical protein [Kordiimonas laminariae]